jgi:hypothetical protein
MVHNLQRQEKLGRFSLLLMDPLATVKNALPLLSSIFALAGSEK